MNSAEASVSSLKLNQPGTQFLGFFLGLGNLNGQQLVDGSINRGAAIAATVKLLEIANPI